MGKSLSSDSARARSQKQKEASRRAAPCSAGRAGAHPYRRRRSGSVLSFLRCIKFNSNQKQRPCQSSFRTLLGQKCDGATPGGHIDTQP